MELITEWIILDPKDPEYKKVVKGSELYLDEEKFEKQVMVYTMVKSDLYSYRGMPFQEQFKSVEFDP